MSANDATFQARVAGALDKLADSFADIERGQAVMQGDVAEIRSVVTRQSPDISIMQSSQKETAGRLHTIERRHEKTDEENRKLGVLLEVLEGKIDSIIEAATPEMEKTSELQLTIDEHKKALTSHDIRLQQLEKAA